MHNNKYITRGIIEYIFIINIFRDINIDSIINLVKLKKI